MVYDWKIPMPVDAQIAGTELQRIEHKFGALTPDSVLNESRDENSVLHPCFEWNDSVAAEKFRLNQARYIIGNITVTVEVPSNDNAARQVITRAFVNVSDTSKGKFVAISTALSQDDTRIRVLKNALAELLMFQNKYQIYAELADVCKAIDDFASTFNVDS